MFLAHPMAASGADYATRTDLVGMEARIYRAMLIQAAAIVGALVGVPGFGADALRLPG